MFGAASCHACRLPPNCWGDMEGPPTEGSLLAVRLPRTAEWLRRFVSMAVCPMYAYMWLHVLHRDWYEHCVVCTT